MSYVPKYIIKRIVPNNAVANLDLNNDKKVDAVGVKYINVLTPMELPADLDIESLKKEFVCVSIDGKEYKDLNDLMLFFEGELLTLKDINKLKGKTLPVGAKVVIVIKLPGGLQAGMHKFGIKTQYKEQTNFNEVEREVTAEIKTIQQLLA
jgi:hypothetical protein